MKNEGGGAVRRLQMSESEIVSSYRTARDPKRQIGILAELNAVTPREIREVLEEAGALMLKPRGNGGGRPLSFDAAAARRMFEAGLSDDEMARKLGVPEKRLADWRRRQGLMRPKGGPCPAAETPKTTAPAAAPEQKEETMATMTRSTSAPAEKADKVVTVEALFDLLRGAVDAGYGEAPVTVEHCRFTEMRLRVELLMTSGLRLAGEPVAVELEGVPEAPAGKEDQTMADVNVALLVSQTVTEAQSQSRIKMGRDYASFYEAWAVLRQRIEETKRDARALEKLHSELWDAIKDGNEDEALIEMGAINASAAALCAAFAGMAAEAQRAVEEQT